MAIKASYTITLARINDGKGIKTVAEYYAVSSSSTEPPSTWQTEVPMMTEEDRYLWNYEETIYTDGTKYESEKRVIGIYGAGTDGKGISSITNYYLASDKDSGITIDSSGWTTEVQTADIVKRYLWNYEKITYTDNTFTNIEPRIIGTCGENGADGKGIKSIVNYYLAYASSTGVTTSTSGWTTEVQSISASKKYLWNYEKITYTDNSSTDTTPCVIGTFGEDGTPGADGVGIKTIQEYYQVSTSNSSAPESWVTTPPAMTATNKYLWNYEKITYTNDDVKETAKRIIGVYGDKGTPGKDGVDGKGISSITNYYLASSSSSGVTTGTSGWTTSIQTISESKKYLWNYEKILYTDDSSTTTTPCIIGTFGENGSPGADGADGVGISSIQEYYQVSTSNESAPSTWQTTPPMLTATNKYLWNYEKISYTNGSSKDTAKRVIGVYGDKGNPGADGIDGVGVKSSEVTYQASTSGTTIPTGSWVSSIPSVSAGQYLWTRTVIVYTDGKTTTSYSVGKMGNNGSNGTSITITSQSVTYQVSDSGTTTPSGNWSTSIPSVPNGKYLWSKTVVTYSDGKSTTSYSVSRNGIDGQDGADGKGIKSITNYYLASASSSGVTTSTSGWTTTIQTVSASKKYLWNYESIAYTSGSPTTTAPCIIGVYGDAGTPGKDGVGISAITEYYQVSTSNSSVPSSWVTTVPTLTATNKYLWNYEKISYTDGSSKDTEKRVIGVYGDKGQNGTSVTITSTSVTYQASTSGTTVPTGNWVSSVPSVAAGSYLWTKTVVNYSDGKSTTSYSVGRMGNNGTNGVDGNDGKGVKSTAITYQAGASQTTAPTGTWGTSVPKLTTSLPYLWTRTVITYTDNSTSTSYSVSSTLDSVEVGGRNLFRFTKNLNIVEGGHSNSNPVIGIHSYIGNYSGFEQTTNGLKYKFKGATANDGICIPLVYEGCINNGDVLTFSFEYKSTTTDPGQWFFLQKTTPNTAFTPSVKLKANQTEWQRYEFVFNSSILGVEPNPRVVFEMLLFTDNGSRYTSNDWIEIRKESLKLEKGNKATDWTPAPEDMATSDDLGSVQEDLENKTDGIINRVTTAEEDIDKVNATISHLVVDEEGNSLMEQTSDGFGFFFNIGGIQKDISDASTDIVNVKEGLEKANQQIDAANGHISDIEYKTAYINLSTDESGKPCIELGKQDNPFKLRITNTSIDFMEGVDRIAYISNRQLYIERSVVTDEMKVGFQPLSNNGFIWKKRGNGNMGLRWEEN